MCCFGSCAGPERREGVWGWTRVGARAGRQWGLASVCPRWSRGLVSHLHHSASSAVLSCGDGSLPQPGSDPTGALQLHTGVTSCCWGSWGSPDPSRGNSSCLCAMLRCDISFPTEIWFPGSVQSRCPIAQPKLGHFERCEINGLQ